MATTKKYLSVFVALILFISANVIASAKTPTIKEYLQDKESYDSYIYGLESGLEWASEHYFRKHNIEMYCKPGNVQLPASRLREMIDRTINAKPGFFQKYENEKLLGLALRNGYLEEFQCR